MWFPSILLLATCGSVWLYSVGLFDSKNINKTDVIFYITIPGNIVLIFSEFWEEVFWSLRRASEFERYHWEMTIPILIGWAVFCFIEIVTTNIERL